jgi:FAD:protein FMN transferase
MSALEATSAAVTWEWRATGTTWRIYHTGGVDSRIARLVAAQIERDEARWSRFRPLSDVSRINAASGRWVPVGADTLALLAECCRWTAETLGVFQPLVGAALEAWGYRVGLQERPPGTISSPIRDAAVGGELLVDKVARATMIPPGMRLDVGGIAKSWIACRAATVLRQATDDESLLIDGGGDLVAVRGSHLVAVEDPGAPGGSAHAHVLLRDGQGVATSGFGRRHWRNADQVEAHHLIDPATGRPGPRCHATVVADDPVSADVVATVLAVRPELIAQRSEACLVTRGDEVWRTPAWAEVLRS